MTPEYIIMTSDYQCAADHAKSIGLEFGQWQWIRDRFKDPVAYKRDNSLPFNSSYQSFEYMAKQNRYFREKIGGEVEAWMEDVGPVIGDAGIVTKVVDFIKGRNV